MQINQQTDALLLIDLQPDFMPGGPLAVPGGDEILPAINTLAHRFDHVLLTQDWHPPQHISFATTHTKNPYETVQASKPSGPITASKTLPARPSTRHSTSPTPN